MSKVWGIEEKDFFVLVEAMNEFGEKNQVYATQVFLKDSVWYALIYYEKKDNSSYMTKDNVNSRQGNKPDFAKSTTPTSTSLKSPITFKPASDKQKALLKKLGYKEDVSKLSKSEAFKLLNEKLPKKK